MLSTLSYLWALPVTLLGLLHVVICGGKFLRIDPGGILIFSGERGLLKKLFFRKFPVAAYTWGTVQVYRTGIYSLKKLLLAHEGIHTQQVRFWGPVFPILYLLSSLWEFLRGRNWYRDNYFERQARGEI